MKFPAFAVVVDQFGIRLDRVADVRREQRITPLCCQINGVPAGGAAVPGAKRLLQGTGQRLCRVQREPVLPRPGHLLLTRQATEQLIVLPVAVPLLLRRDVEELGLCDCIAFAKDQIQPAFGKMVQSRVVLVGSDRVEQAQCGPGGEQPDRRRTRGDVAEYDWRRGGQERPFVAFPDREAVEAQFLGENRMVDDLAEPRVVDFRTPLIGSGPCAMSVIARNFICRSLRGCRDQSRPTACRRPGIASCSYWVAHGGGEANRPSRPPAPARLSAAKNRRGCRRTSGDVGEVTLRPPMLWRAVRRSGPGRRGRV